MQLIGYGEDALTLWALTEKLSELLGKLEDHSDPASCKAFLRPSFGRSGGSNSPQFGEFDFILLSRKARYHPAQPWLKDEQVKDRYWVYCIPLTVCSSPGG